MPKPPPLTPMMLRHLKPPERGQIEITDGGCPGLRLRMSQGGTMTWVLGCRDSASRLRRITLGQYPALGLSDARALARIRRNEVRAGADPIAEAKARRQRARDAKDGVGTLVSVLDAYARLEGGSRRTWPEMRRRISDVFKALLHEPAAELTGATIQVVADQHGSRSSANAAVRYLRPVLAWAEKRGFVSRGISRDLDPGAAAGKRTRVLNQEELERVLRTLIELPNNNHARCLRFILWTAARRTEAGGASWGEIDLGVGIWSIPPERHKSGRGHTVILPQQAREALAAWAGDGTPAPDELIFPSRTGKPVGNWDWATKRLHERSGTSGWQRHDIRRTVATLAGRLGQPPHAIEAMLGHLIGSSLGDVNATLASNYNRARYEREAGEALQAVADELDRLVAGDGTNVLRLHA